MMGRSRSRRRRHHHRQSAYSTKFSQQPLPEAAAGVRGLQQTLPSPYPTRQSSGLWLRFRLKLRRHLRASDQREEPPSMPCSRLNKKAEMGIITHVAVCTSGDWVKIDKIVLGNCVIASQAQRKWHPNVICNVSSGYCRHGAVCFRFPYFHMLRSDYLFI